MARHGINSAWALAFGVAAAALAAACGGSTSPHQPGQCPSFTGGMSQGDSLYGLYHLVSYCLDTLPAYGPPADTGHVTLRHPTAADTFIAVLATQGQAPESILGRYTHPVPDSIHVTGVVKTPLGSLGVEVLGRFLLRHDTLSVSGQLVVVGSTPHPLSFVGARVP
ncbi:MAG TPA: hypothetical protein VEO58_15330 [Gemmatimonadales bacterium]|nr:hypothetical protein [Gemmatimonadales bacterium]